MSFNSGPQTLLGSSDIGQHGVSQIRPHDGMAEDNAELHKMAQITDHEDFEMRRPPYLHVRVLSTNMMNSNTNGMIGHAGWRNWRHQWRYFNALSRHSEDKAAGRSALAT